MPPHTQNAKNAAEKQKSGFFRNTAHMACQWGLQITARIRVAIDQRKKASENGSAETSIRPKTTLVVKNAGAMNSIR